MSEGSNEPEDPKTKQEEEPIPEMPEEKEEEEEREEEIIIDGKKYLLLKEEGLVVVPITMEQVGYINDSGEIEFINEDPERDIPNEKKDERLHSDIYENTLNVGDLLLIFYNIEYDNFDSEVQDIICTIESIDTDARLIKLRGDDLYITELSINEENHIILKTDDYDIIDLEKIELSDEKDLEDLDLRLTKDIIKDIIFNVDITDDKSYTDNEKKEELISELISLLNAYSNNKLIKEITEMCEYYLVLIRECSTKKIDNKDVLTFVTNIINDNKFEIPTYLKPIVSAKRNLYGSVMPDLDTGEEPELDSSIIKKSSENEICELKADLEKDVVMGYNYKAHLNVDMNKDFTNYQFNNNDVKFKTKYEGEYIRDCIDGDTCYGAKVYKDKKKTVSYLHTYYSYDNVKTRNALKYYNLIAETTKEEILIDNEYINMVGLMLMPTNYLYHRNKLSVKNKLFSLEEITAYNKLIYSYEIFKERLKKEQTTKINIDNDTNEDFNDTLTYYLFNTGTIDLDSLGTLLKNNLPSKSDIIENIEEDIYNSIYDINNLERLLDNYDIKFKDLDTVLKQIVIDNIKDNINTYTSSYEKLAKPKKVEPLNVKRKNLSDEERSKKALKYILGLINIRDKYNYLRKYIDLFLRGSISQEENKNYFYNKYSNERSLCKHYEYLIDENKFDTLLNIWKDDTVKDGYICCKNCGEYLCPEGFSPLQGFSDGRPVNTNEKLVDESIEEKSKIRKSDEELINEIQKVFKVTLNIKDLDNILDIIEKVNLSGFFDLRFKKKGVETLSNHPLLKMYKEQYETSKKTAKGKKMKEKLLQEYNNKKTKFTEYISQTNKVILILYLIPLFVQTSIPPYNMKVSFELIDEKKLTSKNLILSKNILNGGMLSYIEKILRDKCRISKTILWENILTLLKESELGLNNIYNNLYDALDYLSDNYFIIKRLNNYKVFLISGGHKYYIKDTWSSYRPIHSNEMIKEINKKINDDKTFTESNKRMENNALLSEINNIKSQEKYKELGISISEFMNNESYKRLLKYSVQLYGKTKESITMINLLINRLINTLDNKSIEPIFEKIGWGKDTRIMKSVDYNALHDVIIDKIPELYKKDQESVRTFIHINKNNFDVRILSTRVNWEKIYSYKGVDIYPLDSYNDLDKKKSKILDKIFSIYCRDEFGNIVVKNDKNYLDYLLLDFNDSEEIDNNCDNKNVFNSNPENFLTYLEFLRTTHKLPFDQDNFKKYIQLYDTEIIQDIETNNLQEFNPNKHLLNFINTNKYLEESNSDSELFQDIIILFDNPEYTLNKETKDKIEGILTNIIDKTDELSEILFDSVENILIENSSNPIFRSQFKRLESYYNLKISGSSGEVVGQINAGTIKVRMKELFDNIIDNDVLEDKKLSEIIEIKINYIKNIYSILSRMKNEGNVTGTEFHNDIPFFWKISKTNKENLESFLGIKEFLIHEDIFGESHVYDGFYEYKKHHYFIGLFNYINGYKDNINDLIGIDSGKYALKKKDINYIINYVFLFILNKINEYIQELIVETDEGGEANDINNNAIQLFQELEKDYQDNKQEMVKECSRLLLDLLQNILEEHNDVNYLHVNKDINTLNKQLGKQKEREKQYLVTELTGQSNEQRSLTLEKQKAGLSNWFENSSKQNEEYRKSEQYKTDTEEERSKRFNSISETFSSSVDKEAFEKVGLNYDDLLKQGEQGEQSKEDAGYGDGRDKVEEQEDYEGENDETDGYDN